MGNVRQDLVYGLRTLGRQPLFALVATVTLALGIGVNVTMFTIVNGVLLSPLPYSDSERLVLVRISLDGETSLPSISPPEVVDFRERLDVFESVATARDASATLTGHGEPVQIEMADVTSNFFSTLGIVPRLGRDFGAEDGLPGAAPSVLLSHGFWQRQFGGDRELVGRSIELDGQPTTVLGVLPETAALLLPREAGLPPDLDAYRPFTFDFAAAPRFRWMRGVARLRDGVEPAQAQAAMDKLAAELIAEHTRYAEQPFEYRLVPLRQDLVRTVRTPLLVLLGAVGFVLLIACGNVANLLLARAAHRERELAVRRALGASRGRLVRQMLTESILLAALGGGLGLLLAQLGTSVVVRLAPSSLPRFDELALDGPVLGFVVGLSLLTLLLFALVPALQSSRNEPQDSFRTGGRHGGGAETARLRRLLVTAEIALSLVLLVGAGLLVQTFLDHLQIRPGFDPSDVHTFQVSLPVQRYAQAADTFTFFERLTDGLESKSGIEAAGGSFPLPMSGRFWTNDYAYDAETRQQWGSVESDNHVVLPGYFRSIGARLVTGRLFRWSDNCEDRPVVVVDTRLAAKAWPGESPLGKQLELLVNGNERATFEVIGVVEHIRQDHPAIEGREQTYILPAQWPFWALPITVRSPLPEGEVASLVRTELQQIDPQLAPFQVRPLGAYVEDVLAGHRFATFLMGLFAGLAVLLAAVGLYGTMAYAVAQRRRELGIRIALGAAPRDVVLLVMGQGLAVTGAGVGVGLIGALLLTRLLSSFLYGVTPFHLPTYAGLTAGLILVALVACLLPTRSAIRRPPAEVLSAE